MPTGYTHKVQTGEVADLRSFALICARGMGALIMMRDDPSDAPIPERFEPLTESYDGWVAESEPLLAELPTLSAEECDRRAQAEFEAGLKSHRERAAERQEHKARYQRMARMVEDWSTEAEGIRSFMLEQLRSSIDFDCNDRFDEPPTRKTGERWREAQLEKASRQLAYATEQRDAEIARTEGRNRWLTALLTSLPPAPTPAEAEAA